MTLSQQLCRAAFVSSVVLGLSWAGAARAATMLSDNFDEDPIGVPASTLANFAISSGSVDVIGSGSAYDFYTNNGHYLDLDGTGFSGTPASVLTSTATFDPGSYLVSFVLGGNARGAPAKSTAVTLGSGTATEVLDSGTGLTTFSFLTTLGLSENLVITENGAADQQGNILASINVSAVPLPSSLPMFGAALLGLAGLGFAAQRKKMARLAGSEAVPA